MRVIAGTARRLLLETPAGNRTRPTQDQIKETLFNMLSQDVPGARFLDLFGGSGGIGIEALSRGASFCCFSDNSKDAIKCMKRNLEWTHLADRACVYGMDFMSALRQMEIDRRQFDIVFLDAPYGQGMALQALDYLAGSRMVDENTLFVLEESMEFSDTYDGIPGYEVQRVKSYKSNQHWFLKRK